MLDSYHLSAYCEWFTVVNTLCAHLLVLCAGTHGRLDSASLRPAYETARSRLLPTVATHSHTHRAPLNPLIQTSALVFLVLTVSSLEPSRTHRVDVVLAIASWNFKRPLVSPYPRAVFALFLALAFFPVLFASAG
jgi:hypothetical protein